MATQKPNREPRQERAVFVPGLIFLLLFVLIQKVKANVLQPSITLYRLHQSILNYLIQNRKLMSSTSETGHAKNVATFEDLISFCTGYGAAYNPSKQSLQIANLQTLRTDALAKLQQVKATKTTFDNDTNARQEVFRPIKPLATRLINALAASGASASAVEDAKTINRKIQGQRATPKPTPPPATPGATTPTPTDKTISSSQQSYDSIIDHFTKLIQSLTQESNYNPNETDLTVTTLNTLLTSMTTSNTGVVDAFTAWSNARIDRNNTLYNALTGLVQTASDVKQYVKSIFGAGSPQYKQISGLEFKAPKI